jgi:hypothetical protein
MPRHLNTLVTGPTYPSCCDPHVFAAHLRTTLKAKSSGWATFSDMKDGQTPAQEWLQLVRATEVHQGVGEALHAPKIACAAGLTGMSRSVLHAPERACTSGQRVACGVRYAGLCRSLGEEAMPPDSRAHAAHASLGHLSELVRQCSGMPIPYPILPYPTLSYPFLSYSTLSYPILSYHIISYPILSYTTLSYYKFPRTEAPTSPWLSTGGVPSMERTTRSCLQNSYHYWNKDPVYGFRIGITILLCMPKNNNCTLLVTSTTARHMHMGTVPSTESSTGTRAAD